MATKFTMASAATVGAVLLLATSAVSACTPRPEAPKRASVNEVGGTDVLAPGYLYHYTLDASKAGAFLISTARSVIDVLHPLDDTLNDPQRLAEQASGTGKPVDLITLRVDDN